MPYVWEPVHIQALGRRRGHGVVDGCGMDLQCDVMACWCLVRQGALSHAFLLIYMSARASSMRLVIEMPVYIYTPTHYGDITMTCTYYRLV